MLPDQTAKIFTSSLTQLFLTNKNLVEVVDVAIPIQHLEIQECSGMLSDEICALLDNVDCV